MGVLARFRGAVQAVRLGRTVRLPDLSEQAANSVPFMWRRESPCLEQWPWITDDMRSDPVVMHVMGMRQAHLLSAGWRWFPGSSKAWRYLDEVVKDASAQRARGEDPGPLLTEDILEGFERHASPISLAMADHANANFGLEDHGCRLDESWEDNVAGLLSYADIGWQTAEALYRVEHNKVWLRGYEPIPVHCHQGWVRRGRRVVAEKLYGVPTPIPAEKLIMLSRMPRPADPRGYGALWGAWGFWRLKCHVANLLGTGSEAWTLPAIVANVNAKTSRELGYDPVQFDKMVTTARTVAADFAAGRTRWLLRTPAISLEAFGGSATWSPLPLIAIMDACDKQMASAWMARQVLMGTSDVAPRAAVGAHQADFQLASGNDLDVIASRVGGRPGYGRGHMTRVLDWTFGRQSPDDHPIFIHDGITPDPMKDLLPQLAPLIREGAITPTDSLEHRLLRIGREHLPRHVRRSPEVRLMRAVGEIAAAPPEPEPTQGQHDEDVDLPRAA